MRITTLRRCTKQSRNTWCTINKYIPIIGGDFNAELGPGKGTERKSVGRYTVNESNKRGDWLKSWLMLNDYYSVQNQFERFRGFLELISRFEFDFLHRDFFFERFEFLVCSKFNHTHHVAVHVPVLWPVCAHTIPFRMLWCFCRFTITFKKYM